MNEVARGPLLCGFGDVAAGLGGLAWDLGDPGALLLNQGEVRAGTFALEEGGDALTLEITAGGDTVEATLGPRTAEIVLGDQTNPLGVMATACVAEVRSKGGTQTSQTP